MTKFDYKKWIVESKFGKTPSYSNYQGSGLLNEQGSGLTCPEGTELGGNWYCSDDAVPDYFYSDGTWIPAENNPTNSGYGNQFTFEEMCCTGSSGVESAAMATTGCEGFANLPQDFQDTICTSCENPNYTNMHCECCPESSTTTTTTTTGPGQTTGTTTGTTTPPIKVPDKLKDPGKKKLPLNLKESKKMNLKELKKRISKSLKNLKEEKLGGEITCFCGEDNTPQTCKGVQIGNKLNCTCCGR